MINKLIVVLIMHMRKHLMLTTLLVSAFAVFSVSVLNILNPALFCLIAVVFSTFLGGFRYGIISGVITVVYCAYFFSTPGQMFTYTSDNFSKIIVILIAVSAMITMVGTLKKQVDTRTQELELVNEQLRVLSTLDGLTGISNRRYFEELLAQEWKRSLRDKTPVSLLMIDIDFFKNYNDTYGHQAGDECLKQITDAFAHRVRRPGDFTARYGGEEFVILLANTPITGAVKVGEDVRQLIENLRIPHKTSQVSQYVTASIGIVSVVPNMYNDPVGFVKKADTALYSAKRSGRNRIQVYVDEVENRSFPNFG